VIDHPGNVVELMSRRRNTYFFNYYVMIFIVV